MAEDITYKFKSQPICRNCGADVRVEYNPDTGYYSKCEKCGSDCAVSPFRSSADEQDWLYRMFCSNFEFGRSETPLKSEHRKLKVFISGPMTGYENFNFKKFDSVADILSHAGVDVVNPVDICRKYKKEKVLADKSVFAQMVEEQQVAEKTCSAILMLNGWEVSNGARLELDTALKNGLDVFQEKDIGLITGLASNPNAKLAVALREIYDEDWKTQSARKYPNVPAGVRVIVITENYTNFYGGPWTRIIWDGNMYWTKSDSIFILN